MDATTNDVRYPIVSRDARNFAGRDPRTHLLAVAKARPVTNGCAFWLQL